MHVKLSLDEQETPRALMQYKRGREYDGKHAEGWDLSGLQFLLVWEKLGFTHPLYPYCPQIIPRGVPLVFCGFRLNLVPASKCYWTWNNAPYSNLAFSFRSWISCSISWIQVHTAGRWCSLVVKNMPSEVRLLGFKSYLFHDWLCDLVQVP